MQALPCNDAGQVGHYTFVIRNLSRSDLICGFFRRKGGISKEMHKGGRARLIRPFLQTGYCIRLLYMRPTKVFRVPSTFFFLYKSKQVLFSYKGRGWGGAPHRLICLLINNISRPPLFVKLYPFFARANKRETNLLVRIGSGGGAEKITSKRIKRIVR